MQLRICASTCSEFEGCMKNDRKSHYKSLIATKNIFYAIIKYSTDLFYNFNSFLNSRNGLLRFFKKIEDILKIQST